MKKIAFLLLTACFVYAQGFSQETKKPAPAKPAPAKTTQPAAKPQAEVVPPAAAKATLSKMYPSVTKVKWIKEKDGGYEAEFDVDKVESSATFDAKGNLVETEKEIAVSSLPANCAAYVAKHYGGQKIKEASEMTATNGIITYEAEIKEGEVIFDKEGNFVKINKRQVKTTGEKDENDEKD